MIRVCYRLGRRAFCGDLDTKARTGSVYKGAQQQAEVYLPHICHQRIQLAAAKNLARAAGGAPPCAGQKSEAGHVAARRARFSVRDPNESETSSAHAHGHT